ncbi:MAG: DNA polymerase IV [Candidatus Paceibacterota bacterium]|jgi:DNA polymerase IV (DinB-like DNA polymerase)
MRIVAHLDMDAFFSSVEERDNSRFKGHPVVVGSDPRAGRGRGVVSTANYKARAYGIRSATPISIAWEYSELARKRGDEPVIFLGVDMGKYEKASSNIRMIIESFGYKIEQASIDEFYIDCSRSKTYKSAVILLRKIKKGILEKELLSCSVGIGPNKLIAKIASDLKKPNGFIVVTENNIHSFLLPMNVSKIPGIGPKSVEILSKLNIKTIGELQNISCKDLEKKFGKLGTQMYQKARGVDEEKVEESHEVKSIGAQETFSEDTHDAGKIISLVKELVSSTYVRFLDAHFVSFSRVSVSVRFSDFTTVQRSQTFLKPLSNKKDLEFFALQMFLSFLDSRENKKRKPIRCIGIRLEKLSRQKNCFFRIIFFSPVHF